MRLITPTGTPGIQIVPGGAEFEYWQHMAALLDPAAYVLQKGNGWSVTVPTGEVFYLMNAWNARFAATGQTFWCRKPNVFEATLLPAGTTIEDNGVGGEGGMAYYCRPSLVLSDTRYRDPRSLYFERIQRRKSLPVFQVHNVWSGGTQSAGTLFPDDFDHGMITLAYVHDGSWTITANAAGSAGHCNLMNEVSDFHQWRAAESMLFPFKRVDHPRIESSGASVSGVGRDLPGNGGVFYHKLPADW